MPYLDATTFQYFNKHRTVASSPGTTEFNVMVEGFSGEFNRFHDATTDICDVSDATMESYLHAKYMADLVEENLVYIEMAENIAPQNRTESRPPSLFDANHVHIRDALMPEKREENVKAYNYNMLTGRIRRWK